MPAPVYDPGAATPASVAAALGSDPAKLTAPVKSVADKYELLPAFLQVRKRDAIGMGEAREGGRAGRAGRGGGPTRLRRL